MTASMVRTLGLLGAAMLLASCSGPLFSKLEVKASPSVYAALGNAKANITDYMSVAKIKDILGSSSDVQVFDYQDPADATQTQKFLVHYPLQSVDLDFGEYMKNLDLDSTLGQTLTPGTFKVPTLNQTQTQTGTLDLNSTLRTQVNGGFSAKTTPFVETGSGSAISATLSDVDIAVTQFTSATFSAGSLELVLSMTGASAGLSLSANIALVDANNATISSTSSPVNIKNGGTASVPLTGKTLPANFKVRFTATTQGGTASQNDTVNVTPSLSSDAKISGASGVTLSTNVSTPSVTIPADAGGKLVTATVGTGKVDITLAALPAGWTGFSRSTTIDLVQDGVTLASGNATEDGKTAALISLNLATKTLNDKQISVNATSTITATNASFTGLSGGTVSVAVEAKVDISLFSSITAKPGTDFKSVQVINQTVSDQMLQWVQDISFDEVGIQFDITNGLPSGNPMTIVMASDALAITGQSAVSLPSGNTATTVKFSNTDTSFLLEPANVADKTSDGKPDLDFTVTITPPGWDGTNMVLSNITPGVSVSVGGNVSFIANWKTAHIKPPNSGSGFTGSFPSDGSKTDLSQLATYLGTDINFSAIPAYLYLSGIDSQVMQAQVVAKYATSTEEALVGTTTATENLTMTATGPTFGTAGSDVISTTWDTSAAQRSFDLKNILNAKPTDLSFDYKFNVGGTFTVNKTDTGSHKIQADLVLILPLSLVATGATSATLGITNPLPKDDLFGRKLGSNNDSINNVLDKLQSMSLSLNLTNKIGLALTAQMTKGTFSKDLTIPAGGGTVNLVLTASDIQYIKNTIPFDLAMSVSMPASPGGTTYNLKRGGTLNAAITVNAVTDIDQTINLRGTN